MTSIIASESVASGRSWVERAEGGFEFIIGTAETICGGKCSLQSERRT